MLMNANSLQSYQPLTLHVFPANQYKIYIGSVVKHIKYQYDVIANVVVYQLFNYELKSTYAANGDSKQHIMFDTESVAPICTKELSPNS